MGWYLPVGSKGSESPSRSIQRGEADSRALVVAGQARQNQSYIRQTHGLSKRTQQQPSGTAVSPGERFHPWFAPTPICYSTRRSGGRKQGPGENSAGTPIESQRLGVESTPLRRQARLHLADENTQTVAPSQTNLPDPRSTTKAGDPRIRESAGFDAHYFLRAD